MQAERAGERLRQGRLAYAGDILDEQVPAGEQAGQREPERGLLADDNAAELLEHQRQALGHRHRITLGRTKCHRRQAMPRIVASQRAKVPL